MTRGRDREGVEEDGPPIAAPDQGIVLGDREAPIGRGRLQSDTEERQGRDGEDRVAEPHREFDHDRRQDIGQDLDDHEIEGVFAPEASRSHVIEVAARS